MNPHPTDLLRCADELTLESLSEPTVYRTFRLGSSTVLVSHMFRLTQTAITAKTCPSHSTDIGPWTLTPCDAVPNAAWDSLMTALNAIDFWHMPSPIENGSFDGVQYVVEGFRDGDYRCFSLRKPHPALTELVADLCDQCVIAG